MKRTGEENAGLRDQFVGIVPAHGTHSSIAAANGKSNDYLRITGAGCGVQGRFQFAFFLPPTSRPLHPSPRL
jgi:hypothetical protein